MPKKKKITRAEQLQRDWIDYNRQARLDGHKEKTFEQYVKMRQGKLRRRPLKGVPKNPMHASTLVRKSPEVPSGFGIGAQIPKKTENTYTGDKLLGIATMHKSNMVPVFKAEDAEDIAKMRRN